MAALAQTGDSTNEFWPEFDFYFNLNEKSRIFAVYTATKSEILGVYADGQTGIHFDVYAVRGLRKPLIAYADKSRDKAVMFRFGVQLF